MPWSVISYAASDIAAYKSSNQWKVWIAGTYARKNGYAVFEGTFDGTTMTWAELAGAEIERIGAGPRSSSGSVVYGIRKDQSVSRWTGSAWDSPGKLKGWKALDLSIKNETEIYFVGTDQKLYRYDEPADEKTAVHDDETFPGNVVRLAAGDSFWLVNRKGEVYRRAVSGGTAWTQEPEVAALDVAAWGAEAWALGRVPRRADGGIIYQKTSDGWLTRRQMGVALACAGANDAWVVNYQGAILRYS
jgi:hypothetical protein